MVETLSVALFINGNGSSHGAVQPNVGRPNVRPATVSVAIETGLHGILGK